MKKCFYSFFLLSFTLCAMEQYYPKFSQDVALIPTRKECKDELKKKNDSWSEKNSELLNAFAQHGPIESFNENKSYYLEENSFKDNELLAWSVSNGYQKLCNILIERGVVQSVGSRRFVSHLQDALKNHYDDIAVALVRANPNFKADVTNEYDHYTLLQLAAMSGSLNFARILLESNYGAKIDQTSKYVEATPLKLAAERQQNSDGFCFPNHFLHVTNVQCSTCFLSMEPIPLLK